MKSSQFTFEAIGTSWSIDIFENISDTRKKTLQEDIYALIEEFDNTYSRFKRTSLITQISKKAGTYDFPKTAQPLFKLAHILYRITGGAFTPLIGNLMEDAGYDSTYSLTPKKLHRPPKWEDVINFSQGKLIAKQPVMLDFGALGKGYLVDLVSDLLKSRGRVSFCVDAGGDMYHTSLGKKPLSVGLEHPENPKQVIGIARIENQSICGSSGNRRKWGKFHHIIDPRTLASPTDILAVWVIADTAILADALATCLYFAEPVIFELEYKFEFLILNSDHSFKMSPNFPAEIYYNDTR